MNNAAAFGTMSSIKSNAHNNIVPVAAYTGYLIQYGANFLSAHSIHSLIQSMFVSIAAMLAETLFLAVILLLSNCYSNVL